MLTLFDTSAISVLQLAPLQWQNELNKDQEKNCVAAKSRPMMNLTSRMPSVVSSSTSSNPGRTSYGYQDPGKSVASDNRSGKPEKTSWAMMQQVALHREEPLLDGNAHSARYGDTISRWIGET